MGLSEVERLMGRRQVDALIKSDPAVIHPLRKTKIPDSSGGHRWSDPTPIAEPLEVLIAPAKRRLSPMMVNTELGNVVEYPYIVLARHNADLNPDDIFTWEGDEFEVKSIHIKTQVSITAQVDYYGGTKNA